jgi:hypothetical protein
MSNKRAVETLGMSHGAACSRLRKMVLFRQLAKYDDNVCVRCSEKIENIDELSIEHVKPWEGLSADLFWDLDNVAFSHMRCNKPHTFHGGVAKRKIAPDGMSWCVGCKKFEPIENFTVDRGRWTGLAHYCRESRLDR